MENFQDKLREWFWGRVNKILKYKFLILFSISIIIFFIAIWCLYLHLANGYTWSPRMGFEDKTIWDVLDLIIIPLFLAIGAWWITSQEKNREIDSQEKRAQVDREIAEERQRENTLRDYLDKMSDLLLKERLIEKKEKDKTLINIARVRTITALRALNTSRQNQLIQFLRDANLEDFILTNITLDSANLANIILYGFNLSKAKLISCNLENALLSKINLEKAYLYQTNLKQAYLNEATLIKTNFEKANLQGANFIGANLKMATLHGTNISEADLSSANLQGASLIKANFEKANLVFANLKGANLLLANLTGAKLNEANLEDAYLSKCIITEKQLSSAHLSRDTLMPDGSKYDGRFDKKPDES